MIYDVTKGSNTVKIEKDVKAVYPTATIKRLSKDSKQLRTVNRYAACF